jgi:hypothetical protein
VAQKTLEIVDLIGELQRHEYAVSVSVFEAVHAFKSALHTAGVGFEWGAAAAPLATIRRKRRPGSIRMRFASSKIFVLLVHFGFGTRSQTPLHGPYPLVSVAAMSLLIWKLSKVSEEEKPASRTDGG